MALQEIILTMGRFGSTPLRFAFVAACGTFMNPPASCTSYNRTSDPGNTRLRRVGFRVVSRIEP